MSISLSSHGDHGPGRLRAAWADLVCRRRRRMLADGWDGVLEDVLRPPSVLTPRAPVDRQQVLDAHADIEQLIARLRDMERPIDRRGLVRARALLCDHGSPLYTPAEPATLRRAVRLVCEAME